jgi:hypothetical protein
MDNEFREQLERRIAGYLEMEEQFASRIVDLQEQLAAVRRRSQAAGELYKVEYGREFDRSSSKRRSRESLPSGGPLSGMKWGEAIARAISDAGRPLHVKEIWTTLEAGGFDTQSSDPERSIVSICVRSPLIIKTAPGTYSLNKTEDGQPSLWPPVTLATPTKED